MICQPFFSRSNQSPPPPSSHLSSSRGGEVAVSLVTTTKTLRAGSVCLCVVGITLGIALCLLTFPAMASASTPSLPVGMFVNVNRSLWVVVKIDSPSECVDVSHVMHMCTTIVCQWTALPATSTKPQGLFIEPDER